MNSLSKPKLPVLLDKISSLIGIFALFKRTNLFGRVALRNTCTSQSTSLSPSEILQVLTLITAKQRVAAVSNCVTPRVIL